MLTYWLIKPGKISISVKSGHPAIHILLLFFLSFSLFFFLISDFPKVFLELCLLLSTKQKHYSELLTHTEINKYHQDPKVQARKFQWKCLKPMSLDFAGWVIYSHTCLFEENNRRVQKFLHNVNHVTLLHHRHMNVFVYSCGFKYLKIPWRKIRSFFSDKNYWWNSHISLTTQKKKISRKANLFFPLLYLMKPKEPEVGSIRKLCSISWKFLSISSNKKDIRSRYPIRYVGIFSFSVLFEIKKITKAEAVSSYTQELFAVALVFTDLFLSFFKIQTSSIYCLIT